MDGPTDRVTYRVACTRLKRKRELHQRNEGDKIQKMEKRKKKEQGKRTKPKKKGKIWEKREQISKLYVKSIRREKQEQTKGKKGRIHGSISRVRVGRGSMVAGQGQ